ncbi:NUDIX hydrolase [Umezawaea sp. Da 62-37]|uniref:NUDIX hydrolase n=1 Tax=Umezawaea sp. Da 62-37 TaxID=3075927 RepID=UPI0028F6EADD|nr:NUDIX hydrolase [Umezawaea sp. Da 62-37]WNV83082.1 NUDIX hydrolase [Umezawaea sp. Da 62-37]
MSAEHAAATPSTVGQAMSVERVRVSARGVIRDRQGWVLAVRLAPERRPPGKEFLNLPGGTVHQGELPTAAASREVHEELGLTDLFAGRLLLTVWNIPPYSLLRPRLQLLFDFGRHDRAALSARIVLPAEEISDYKWLSPRSVDRYLYPLQAKQLRAVAEHRIYLEQEPVPRADNVR